MKTETRTADPAVEPAPLGTADIREIELKFLLDEAAFKAAQRSDLLGGDKRRAVRLLRSVYFDTAEGHLRRNRTVLRMRTYRGVHLMTLKDVGTDPTNPFIRAQIEVKSPSAEPDLTLLHPAVAAEIRRATDDQPLIPRFSTEIRRSVQQITSNRSEIEVAFDTGTITAGTLREPVREIELELKSGDVADLFALGLALTETVPARLGILSKSERGWLLSTGGLISAVRADSPVQPHHSVDDVLATVIGTCIRQFTANWPAFERGDSPGGTQGGGKEPVHQMRVAMRRLRAAFGLFHRGFPCRDFVALREEAKRIASAMGDARNWDVFADLVHDGPGRGFSQDPGFAPLLVASGELRTAGHATVDALLKSGETTRFVLSALTFVARRGWRNEMLGADLPTLSAPAAGFAARCLARLDKQVRKRGRHIVELPADSRHEVRIALKKLRYATDFFAPLFPDTHSVRSYARAAARLQDVLGRFNDMAMATDLVNRLPLDNDPAASRAAGIVLGWYGRDATMTTDDLQETWRRFRKAKPFWTDALDREAVEPG